MWGYFPGLVWHLAATAGGTVDDAPGLLDAAFPGLRYIHVTRRDKERQAMSLWRALQTWTWRADQAPPADRPSVFCRRAIEHLAASLEADDAAWRAWYARNGLEPAISVVYEELAADHDGGLRKVLDALGLPLAAERHRAAPRLRRAGGQRDRGVAASCCARRASGDHRTGALPLHDVAPGRARRQHRDSTPRARRSGSPARTAGGPASAASKAGPSSSGDSTTAASQP